jgi:hypothetical protein
MAVALTALFVALGGTGYAATQLNQRQVTASVATKKRPPVGDKTADTKLIKKLAAKLSVAFATSAGTAANASHAATAASATHAATQAAPLQAARPAAA